MMSDVKTETLYEVQFPHFYKAMMDEMERHYPEKGDSYHECTVEHLEKLLRKSVMLGDTPSGKNGRNVCISRAS